MKFSTFIRDNVEAIIDEWDTFAETLVPAARTMSNAALRDHSREILLAICIDMEAAQTEQQRAEKSMRMEADTAAKESAAATHGGLRQLEGFDLLQLVGEFRSMRASVLLLWRRSVETMSGEAAIEEVIRFNEALDKALAESVESYSNRVEASRDMFLAVLGHDLRSPLSTIDLSSRTLARAGLAEIFRQQAVARIGRATQVMNGLITDLLDFTRSRLGSGIPIERTPCDLRSICNEALDAARASHAEVKFESAMSGNLQLEADAPRLHQVLANLLSNAAQHGERSEPILLNARGEAEHILLQVANAGKAIPADILQVIFEPLVQAPSAASEFDERSKTSLGLGLYIVRQIVLGHEGEVGVASSTESGTVFTIRLPHAPTRAVAQGG